MKSFTAKAWVVALSAWLGGIALALNQNKVIPVIQLIMDEFQASMATAGWLSSIFAVIGVFISLPTAMIIKKYGVRACALISLTFVIIGSLIGTFSTNTGLLLVSRGIEGAGLGLMGILGPTVISMWFPSHKRGLPMAVFSEWQTVAFFIVFFTGDGIAQRYGWQGVWWFGTILALCALAVCAAFVKAPPLGHSFADVEADVPIKEGLRSLSAWLMGLAFMLFCICYFGLVTWAGTYLNEVLGMSVNDANQAISLISVAELVAILFVGILLNKVRNRKLLLVIPAAVLAVLSVYAFHISSVSMVIPFMILFGIAEAFVAASIFTIAPDAVKKPEYAGVAVAIVCMMQNVGMVIGAPLVGAVIEKYGWAAGSVPITIAPVLLIICVLLARVKTNTQPFTEASKAAAISD